MGRSISCLKIITCNNSDSADNDHLDVSEKKSSGDKRRWSFRKRSASHRVLSNTAISEIPSSTSKESPDSAGVNLQQLDNSPVPEKTPSLQCLDEKIQLSDPLESEQSKVVSITVSKSEEVVPKVDDNKLDESVVIIIQTAIRVFLARKKLLKLKKVIKLQAAVRGHLVRRHAVGTLRCVQAIVKMQALVRARRARISVENRHDSLILEKESSAAKPKAISTSMEKLLSNRFASQLMKATPKTKTIHVKCDSSKPNSAWTWLERWMAVSSTEQTVTPDAVTDQVDRKENADIAIASPMETISSNPNEGSPVPHDADNIDLHTSQNSNSSTREELEQQQQQPPLSENTNVSSLKETTIAHEESQVKEDSTEITSDANTHSDLTFLPNHPEPEETEQQPKRSMKRLASEQLDTEGKKFGFGTRKTTNPAFIAVQSKFEELTSTTTNSSSRSSSSSHLPNQEATEESKIDTTVKRVKELSVSENPPCHLRTPPYGGSECGTELSISSTLDSPDRSEVAAVEYEQETSHLKDGEQPDTIKAKEAPVINLTDSSSSIEEKLDNGNGEPESVVILGDSSHVEERVERSASDLKRVLSSEMDRQVQESTTEASPGSHMIATEVEGTPSSQVSVKSKKNRSSKQKKVKPLSKGSPSNPNNDSGVKSSTEQQVSKDLKNGKRRSSFGSGKSENVDQEPRDSCSSNSLPHFMQATQSARAKLNANSSPRSSPDLQDRVIYIKKRHSLPGADGRQGSPRIQRPKPQASQQGVKGSGTPPTQEKKWQR